MRLGDVLNNERVSALRCEPNVCNNCADKNKESKGRSAEYVMFPQGYENAGQHYDKSRFSHSKEEEPCKKVENCKSNSSPMFNMGSVLPMLMGGGFGEILKPLMGLLGGGGGADVTKIFELFKPKQKQKKEEVKEEDFSSKFDDMIIIED